ILLGQDGQGLVAHDKLIASRLDLLFEHTVHRVILQEVRHRPRVCEIVDGNELEGWVIQRGPEDLPPDPSEPVDADTNRHGGAAAVREKRCRLENNRHRASHTTQTTKSCQAVGVSPGDSNPPQNEGVWLLAPGRLLGYSFCCRVHHLSLQSPLFPRTYRVGPLTFRSAAGVNWTMDDRSLLQQAMRVLEWERVIE